MTIKNEWEKLEEQKSDFAKSRQERHGQLQDAMASLQNIIDGNFEPIDTTDSEKASVKEKTQTQKVQEQISADLDDLLKDL